MQKNSIISVIDADSIVWIIAYHHKEDTNSLAMLEHLDKYITELLVKTNAHAYVGFLGGTRCFRYEVAKHKPYKGNRSPKPDYIVKWEPILKDHMVKQWGFMIVDGIEADDAASIAMKEFSLDYNPLLCHLDKDMDQIVGNHYNYQKKTFYHIDTETAEHTFWMQVLTGDGTDNIAGVPGLGPAKAAALLKGLKGQERQETVRAAFIKYYAEYYGNLIYQETVDLVCMLRYPKYGFVMPTPVVWSPEIDVLTKGDELTVDANNLF